MARRVVPVGVREVFLGWLVEGLPTKECAARVGVVTLVDRDHAIGHPKDELQLAAGIHLATDD